MLSKNLFISIFAILLGCGPKCAPAAGDLRQSGAAIFTVNCDDLARVAGAEQLSRFERVSGVYEIPKRAHWRRIAGYGGNTVFIPVGNSYKPSALPEPLVGIKFIDPKLHITVSIISRKEKVQRRALFMYTRRELSEKFGNVPLFFFLEKSLGVDKYNFCESDNAETTVSMFMSTAIIPIPGRAKTKVYMLENPKALLLITDEQSGLFRLIFPGKDKDSLDYAVVSAPPKYIHNFISSLVLTNGVTH